MSTFIIRRLICHEQEDITFDDHAMIIIEIDGAYHTTLEKSMDDGETWDINQSFTFNNSIKITLKEADWPDADDFLGSHTITNPAFSVENNVMAFTQDDADYELIYGITVTGTSTESPIEDISLRRFLGRMSVGVMDDSQHDEHVKKDQICRYADEVISFSDIKALHQNQDGNKSNTLSVREWISSHCNYFSPQTYISDKPDYRNAAEVVLYGNWEPVTTEGTRMLAGFQHYSRVTNTDNPISHETRDWNNDVIPDPQFMYLLAVGMKGWGNGLSYVPIIHNEWETGSFPGQWRPFWGEYVSIWGRHIWDMGHSPVRSEIHPPHTVVREHTTAAPIGNGNTVVPVNRAIIGMGLSGGYPGETGARWNAEFGGEPDQVWGDTTDCWATNLKNHPLSFKLYPPVTRPSQTATLNTRIVLAKYIRVNNWSEGDDFLELTQFDDPADGGEEKAFRDFMDAHGYPPVDALGNLQPQFQLKTDSDGNPAYVDVNVNLSSLSGIPVGYYAIVECGWSVPGDHILQEYRLTFETIRAIETDEWWDDWHLHYGVNGNWSWWWTDNFIEEGETYTRNTVKTFWTVDDLPIAIHDSGVEWDGTDFGNERIDPVELIATPTAAQNYNHFKRIADISASNSNVDLVSPPAASIDDSTTEIRFRVKGTGGDTRHQWTIHIERLRRL